MAELIIASWVCFDDDEGASYFPSAKGNSSDSAVQMIYLRCLAVFLFSARIFNPQARLIVFSNVKKLPFEEEIGLEEIMRTLKVEMHFVPFAYKTPKGYFGRWRNQFYEFSIFDYAASHPSFSSGDRIVLLDSDCVVNRDLADLGSEIALKGCITYRIDYSTHAKINGLTRQDMGVVYSRLGVSLDDQIPHYYGGEFFAARVDVVRNIAAAFRDVWGKLLDFHSQGEMKLNEEAHVLSYIFLKLKIDNNIGNKYIKRIWTDSSTFRNVSPDDVRLSIWHLPAEKRFGFTRLFRILQKNGFDVTQITRDEFRMLTQRCMQVPTLETGRMIFYGIKKMVKKIVS